ncbi:hypothetical protein VVR12_03235 [Rothia sp. LK2588]|uniref:hypothetical protein n=1 Tax=Rothia sp. LK2588 TaxID=3114369 RepID=UPI0034CD9D09
MKPIKITIQKTAVVALAGDRWNIYNYATYCHPCGRYLTHANPTRYNPLHLIADAARAHVLHTHPEITGHKYIACMDEQ